MLLLNDNNIIFLLKNEIVRCIMTRKNVFLSIFFLHQLKRLLTLLIFLSVIGAYATYAFEPAKLVMQEQERLTMHQRLMKLGELSDSLEYDRSIEMASTLITEAKQKNDNRYLFHGYNYLSLTYDLLSDTIPALDYAEKALHYAKLSKNDTLISWGLNNLAASLAYFPKRKNEVLKLYKESLVIQRRLNDGEFIDAALNIAELYRDDGNYTMMYPYLKEAQDSYDPESLYYDNPKAYLDILWGDYYKGLQFDNKALSYYKSAFELVEAGKMEYLALDFYDRYAKFLAENNKPEEAYAVHQRYFDYYSHKERTKATETVQLAQARLEAEELRRERNDAKFKQEILDQNLKRKKTQSVLLGSIIGLMVLFLAYLFYSEKLRLGLIKNLKVNNKHLKKAKERAEKSERAKTKFFSNLSHEMRTPLYGVTGIVSLLEKSEAFKDYKEEIGSLKFSADHLLEIINDLLDLSKLEDESFKLVKKPFNIKLLAEELVTSFEQHSLKNSNCKIICDVDASIPNYVVGDSRRISQILLNILGNAVKFTPKGVIALRLKDHLLSSGKHAIYFEVEDNGIGIPQEMHESIFDEFSQIDEKSTANKGTGLGLPIVRKLLLKMGSDIALKSEPGRGSTFSFVIEFKEATLLEVIGKRKKEESEDAEAFVADLTNQRVLIVDDNKINRMVTRRVLERQHAEVFEAQNGEEALALTQKSHYDLILMDINMPGMNGYETSKEIRAFDKEIPIIALTAAEAEYIRKKAKEYGMNDVITKPYNLSQFSKVIVKELKINTLITGSPV